MAIGELRSPPDCIGNRSRECRLTIIIRGQTPQLSNITLCRLPSEGREQEIPDVSARISDEISRILAQIEEIPDGGAWLDHTLLGRMVYRLRTVAITLVRCLSGTGSLTRV